MIDIIYVIFVCILCNDVCIVVEGIGKINVVKFLYVLYSFDVCIGDILVIFGLGGIFFEGYLVVVVIEINCDEGCFFV